MYYTTVSGVTKASGDLATAIWDAEFRGGDVEGYVIEWNPRDGKE